MIDLYATMKTPETPEPSEESPENSLPEVRAYKSTDSVKAALAPYQGLLTAWKQRLAELEIIDDETNRTAAEMGLQAKRLAKAVEDIKKTSTAPFRRMVTDIGNVCQALIAPLNDIQDAAKRKQGAYLATIRELERRKAEEEARKALEARQAEIDKEAEAAGVETVKLEQPIVPAKTAPTRTAEGTAYEVTETEISIEDESLIPREYLVVDMAKVRKAVKAGNHNIPGIKVTEVKKVRYRG